MNDLPSGRFSWVGRAALIVVLVPALAFLLSVLAALFLMPRDPLRHADAVVVISGGGPERLAHGLQLYQQGFAERLVLSGAASDPQARSNAESMRHEAVAAGVPQADILVDITSETTYQNAARTHELLGDVDALILVTSAYHQRRAYVSFRSVYDDEVAILNSPAEVDFFGPLNWWRSPRGRRLFGAEYGKLVYVYLTGKHERY